MVYVAPGEFSSGTTPADHSEDFNKECVVRVILKKNVVDPDTLVYAFFLFFCDFVSSIICFFSRLVFLANY